MLPNAQKLSYARSVLRRQYTGATISSGLLVIGKFYRATEFKTGDDFSNVGVPVNRCGLGSKGFTGAIFQATATTPTVWTNGSRLTELKVADLRAYSLEVFNSATDQIIITSGNFEGGGQSGEINFPKDLLGKAVETLLAEMDPDYVADSPIPRRQGGIRVLVG